MELPLYQIDTFTSRVFSGNPAAVCLLNEWLPDEILQAVAAETGLPVTTFVVAKNEQYEIRWFKAMYEYRSICVHGTLAAAYVLLRWVYPWLEKITFHSSHEPLTIVRSDNHHYLMDLPANPALPCAMPEGLGEALGVMPRQILKANAHLAVLESERQVRQLKPDLHKLMTTGCQQIILTAPGDRVDFVSRYFNLQPFYEDAVTGSAHCTLMPYWARRLGKTRLEARQVSARGGELSCELRQDRVLITGTAVPFLQGTITIPD